MFGKIVGRITEEGTVLCQGLEKMFISLKQGGSKFITDKEAQRVMGQKGFTAESREMSWGDILGAIDCDR